MEGEKKGLTPEEKAAAIRDVDRELAELEKVVPDQGGFRVTKPAELLDVISARDLQKLDIPPAEFIIRDFLPLGLALLGAPAKSYKSYMCLDMALCICRGFDFLGFRTKKCACLYMDLESTRRRPKSRMEQILKGELAPDDLYIVTKAPPLGKGFEERVREEKAGHPEIGLVIVDVFKKIRPSAKKYTDPYERDYEDYGLVKSLADELSIAILLVTHTTKMKHPEDPFNELSGSAGTMGSIDAAMVIKKENREDETAKLYITGRDLESQCYEMKFNKQTFRWEMQGTHKDMEQMRAECEYRNSPIVRTVKILLDQNDGHWKGTASDMIKASYCFRNGCIHDKPQQVGTEINRFISFFKKLDNIGFHREITKKTSLLEFWYFDTTITTVPTVPTDTTFPASEWEYCGKMRFDDIGGNGW